MVLCGKVAAQGRSVSVQNSNLGLHDYKVYTLCIIPGKVATLQLVHCR